MKRSRVGILVLASLLALALVIPSCAPAPSDGGTTDGGTTDGGTTDGGTTDGGTTAPKIVKIGTTLPLTGPASPWGIVNLRG